MLNSDIFWRRTLWGIEAVAYRAHRRESRVAAAFNLVVFEEVAQWLGAALGTGRCAKRKIDRHRAIEGMYRAFEHAAVSVDPEHSD